MTNLEAFKASTEYRSTDDNLFTKILLDNGITGGTTYAASAEQSIDIALADLYLYLATHPDIAETGHSEKWDRNKFIQLRRDIYSKWGLDLPETLNQKGTISGKSATFAGTAYNRW